MCERVTKKGIEIIDPNEVRGVYGEHSDALLEQHDPGILTTVCQGEPLSRTDKENTAKVFLTIEGLWESLKPEERIVLQGAAF